MISDSKYMCVLVLGMSFAYTNLRIVGGAINGWILAAAFLLFVILLFKKTPPTNPSDLQRGDSKTRNRSFSGGDES